MKIKKTFQGVIPENKILNAESASQTDTYSCDYINEKVKEIYSTEEVRIGTWIDGKPLYRKVINAKPTISNSSYQTISIKHNINDLKNIHKCNGFLHNNGNTQTYILPTDTSATQTIGIREINNTNIIMYSKNDTWSGWIAEIILEYTKTTD